MTRSKNRSHFFSIWYTAPPENFTIDSSKFANASLVHGDTYKADGNVGQIYLLVDVRIVIDCFELHFRLLSTRS